MRSQKPKQWVDQPSLQPSSFNKTRKKKSQKFVPTIFDWLPKEILYIIFQLLIDDMKKSSDLLLLNERYRKAYKTRPKEKNAYNTWYGEHPTSYEHLWLRKLAQTCRSLHIKVKSYRALLQDTIIKKDIPPDRPTNSGSKFIAIEKRLTKQKTKHRKSVNRYRNYQTAKNAVQTMVLLHKQQKPTHMLVQSLPNPISCMALVLFRKEINMTKDAIARRTAMRNNLNAKTLAKNSAIQIKRKRAWRKRINRRNK